MTATTPVRLAMTKLLAAAAAAILVVGSLAVGAHPGAESNERTLDTLLTAAEQATAQVGSARVSVEGHGSTHVRLTNLDEFLGQVPSVDEMLAQMPTPGAEDEGADIPDIPDLPALPERPDLPSFGTPPEGAGSSGDLPDVPELELPEPDCTDLPEDECEALKEANEQAQEDLRKAIEAAREAAGGAAGAATGAGVDGEGAGGEVPDGFDPDMREQFEAERAAAEDAARADMKAQMEQAQAEFEQKLAEIPREFTCTFAFSGAGTMAIPGKADIGGDADVHCEPEIPAASANFHVVVGQDGTYTDNGDGTFTQMPGGGDQIGSLVASGADLSKLLAAAHAEGGAGANDHGTETLDGVEVRHISFAADPGSIGGIGEGSTTVDVWIGVKDHVVRKAIVRSSGKASQNGIETEWSSEQTLLVTDVNLPTGEIDIPQGAEVMPAPPAANEFNGMTNPFGGSMPTPYVQGGQTPSVGSSGS